MLDAAAAATSMMIGLSVASDTEPAIALLPFSIGAIYLAGAIKGNSSVNKCREAMTDYERYTAGVDTAPTRAAEQPDRDDEVAEVGRHPIPPATTAAQPTAPVRTPLAAQPAAPTPAPPAAPVPDEEPASPPVSSPAPAAAPPATVAAPAKPATPTKPATKPAAKSPVGDHQGRPAKQDDEWSDFWREVH